MHDLLAPKRHQPLLPKRTRRNVKQSRYGCLTCRARRKKCDEMKPVCLRCTNDRRICEYTERAIQLSSGFSCSEAPFQPRLESPQRSNQRLPRRYSNQEGRLYELCFETFLQGCNRELHLVDQTELMQLFTQLSPVSEAVRTSMIYFGAVLGALNTAGMSDNLQSLALRNQNALEALQHEIATMQIGPAPVFVAGIVLAAAEVLVRRVTTALTHVRGAFMALRYTCEPRNSQALWSNHVSSHMSRDVASTIQMLALLTDIHVASYRLSEPPDLPQIFHVRTTRVSTTDTFGDDIEIVAFLHGCRHYISRAAKFRYSPFAEVPTVLLDEQNRYFSILSCWLSESRLRSSLKLEYTTRRLVTRAKCLSTLISVSTVLSPDEKAYDAHSKHFNDILEICERVLSNTTQSPSPSLLSNFQLQPGIFEPLYLTAMKYRHPYHRRRAIDMFAQLGLEGPWNATIMAEISRKAIEIEEGGSSFQSTAGHDRHNAIPEVQRVHHCSFGIPPLDVNKFPILVRAEFRLRTDVEGISRSGIECDGLGREPEWTIKRERIEIKECFPTRSMN